LSLLSGIGSDKTEIPRIVDWEWNWIWRAYKRNTRMVECVQCNLARYLGHKLHGEAVGKNVRRDKGMRNVECRKYSTGVLLSTVN
jgi:hypothetical protein